VGKIKLFKVQKLHKPNGKCWWSISGAPKGKRQRHFFLTEKLAKQAANDRNEEIKATGSQDMLPHSVRIAALVGTRQLEPYGKNLNDAVDFYLTYLKQSSSSITVSELCAKVQIEFENRLKSGESSLRHFESMKETLKKFKGKFGESKIKLITGSEIKSWLSETPLAIKTKNRHLGYVQNIFGRAKEWGLLTSNPLDGLPAFNNPKKEKIEILTPAEMTSFLNALDKRWLNFFSICAFTGLRREEVLRLDWNEIKLERRLIDLPSTKSKNRRRKLIEIPDNLYQILLPSVKDEGSIIPNKYDYGIRAAAAKIAGLVPWKSNCLRHSFCSYSVTLKGIMWTAAQADHSESVLKKNYLEVTTKEDAELYFKI
jgi:integrase